MIKNKEKEKSRGSLLSSRALLVNCLNLKVPLLHQSTGMNPGLLSNNKDIVEKHKKKSGSEINSVLIYGGELSEYRLLPLRPGLHPQAVEKSARLL